MSLTMVKDTPENDYHSMDSEDTSNVDIYGKGYVENSKYHSKKQTYIVQSGKVRDWVKSALVYF